MRIRFIGLISHVLNSAGEHLAVLIHEKDHIPRLIYENGDVAGEQDGDESIKCADLANSAVTTSLTGLIDRNGLNGVPKLSDLGGKGNLHADLDKAHNPVANRFTSVMVLGGDAVRGASYYIEDWFQNHGTFGGMFGVKQYCLPQTVVLDIPTTSDVTITITPTGGVAKTITFKPVATATIVNAEIKTGAASHFNLYNTIYEDKIGVPLVTIQGPKPEGISCSHGSMTAQVDECPEGGGQTVGVECSNSQYP